MKDWNTEEDDRVKINPVHWYWVHAALVREQELKDRRADLFTFEIRSKICHVIRGN